MLDALNKLAVLECKGAFTLDWAQLRYQPAVAIRARRLAPPFTANKILSALRSFIKKA